MNKIKIMLAGAGGYASNYVNELLDRCPEDTELVGIVEKYPDSCAGYEKIKKSGIPLFDTVEAFFQQKSADLVCIATPPFLHCEQSRIAMENGAAVLTEKPLTTDEAEAEAMIGYESKYQKFLAVGYQWSFSDAILELKKDILSGALGKPLSMKTLICWPREKEYFQRGSGWGGRLHFNGKLILDSVASNACAHYLHNMLFLLGDTMESSAHAHIGEAQCLRANRIESFDTCVIKAVTDGGVPLFFIASHTTDKTRNPQFTYQFSGATVSYSQDEADCATIKAVFPDGREKDYGNPFAWEMKKLYACIDAVRTGTTPVCTARTAEPHTRLITELYRTTPIRDFPEDRIRYSTETGGIYVEGLYEEILASYETAALLPFSG